MASAGKIEVRIIGGHALRKQEIAILRLLKAIAEQEREDREADAATYRAERDEANRLNAGLRRQAEVDRMLLRAARCVGRDQEREIEHLREHVTALTHDEFDVVQREQDLIARIDVYQCEIEGLKAELSEALLNPLAFGNAASLATTAARIRGRHYA